MSEASPTSGQRQLQRKKSRAETVRLTARAARKRRNGVALKTRAGLGGGMGRIRGSFPFGCAPGQDDNILGSARADSKGTCDWLHCVPARGEEVDGGAEDDLVALVVGQGAGGDDAVALAGAGEADADDFDFRADGVVGADRLGPAHLLGAGTDHAA